jgi:hypothetical protein
MDHNQQAVMHAFFEAMAAGWAQDAQKDSVLAFPQMKAIPFVLGDFRVMDAYYVGDRGLSSGTTTIWLQDKPVWIMHYGGHYPDVAMGFLKECLLEAYVRRREFFGGRGPYFVRGERFTYVNRVASEAFSDFEGEERVFDLDNREIGSHWYRGMSLVTRRRQ